MADFSDTALENVKTQDLGEIGELISNVVGELKDFDVQEEGKFFGFFKKQASKIENLKNKYDKAQANVEKITDSLQQHQVRLILKNLPCISLPEKRNWKKPETESLQK